MKLSLFICIWLSLFQLDTDPPWGTPCLAMWLPRNKSLASNKLHRFWRLHKHRQCYNYKANLPAAPHSLLPVSFISFVFAGRNKVQLCSSGQGPRSWVPSPTALPHMSGCGRQRQGLQHSPPTASGKQRGWTVPSLQEGAAEGGLETGL